MQRQARWCAGAVLAVGCAVRVLAQGGALDGVTMRVVADASPVEGVVIELAAERAPVDEAAPREARDEDRAGDDAAAASGDDAAAPEHGDHADETHDEDAAEDLERAPPAETPQA